MISSCRIGIVVSKFNTPITEKLLKGALQALSEKGVPESNIDVIHVPGAYEISITLKKLCNSEKNYDGLIALGCLIKGETAHFEYICNSVSTLINSIACEFEIPIGFGVLTCYTAEQAYERSLDDPINAERNKGYESTQAVLEMVETLNKI
ncbi:MAG: 6,7-dimethyl-8-ribityllumazine synthase [Ignavibacteriae bacterium]|nr:6,7-dimethyl-8-ribityllumazine synthase [Ignavibacteriota bacterium]MCB9244313.1 6,7-dimethyl-8-ribityllumazine synthase [Ignavibacteriales bacterium]